MRPVDRLVAVDAPLTDTWQTLIDAESWPEWVSGLRSVEVHPPGKVDRNTSATLRYTSGRSMYVAVTECLRQATRPVDSASRRGSRGGLNGSAQISTLSPSTAIEAFQPSDDLTASISEAAACASPWTATT